MAVPTLFLLAGETLSGHITARLRRVPQNLGNVPNTARSQIAGFRLVANALPISLLLSRVIVSYV